MFPGRTSADAGLAIHWRLRFGGMAMTTSFRSGTSMDRESLPDPGIWIFLLPAIVPRISRMPLSRGLLSAAWAAGVRFVSFFVPGWLKQNESSKTASPSLSTRAYWYSCVRPEVFPFTVVLVLEELTYFPTQETRFPTYFAMSFLTSRYELASADRWPRASWRPPVEATLPISWSDFPISWSDS